LTDAISVSCKALGIAADVYWNEDTTKYSDNQAPPPANVAMITSQQIITLNEQVAKYNEISGKTLDIRSIFKKYGVNRADQLTADNAADAINGMSEALRKIEQH
jgi:hypothetical protein